MKKAVEKSGMGKMTTNENAGSMEPNDKLAAHFLRGHGGSVMHVLQSEEGASWSAEEHLNRARHLEASFQKSYSRGMVARVRVAFRRHQHKARLRPEEALIL